MKKTNATRGRNFAYQNLSDGSISFFSPACWLDFSFTITLFSLRSNRTDQKGLRTAGMDPEHCHSASHEKTNQEQQKKKTAIKKLCIATALSALFMIGEVAGGYLANSLAVMTDACHMLADVSSFIISILALKLASKPISKRMTFGWHRAVLISLTSASSLFSHKLKRSFSNGLQQTKFEKTPSERLLCLKYLKLLSTARVSNCSHLFISSGEVASGSSFVFLCNNKLNRLVTSNYDVNGKNMLVTAGLAVGFNVLLGFVLHEHGHSHDHMHGGHDHSHGHPERTTSATKKDGSKQSGNINVRAAFIHAIGDLVQSLGVFAAALIIYFKPDYKVADPICTFIFSALVLITTFTIVRDILIVIMEGSPVGVNYNDVLNKLLEIDGVAAVHDLRLWSLTINHTVMTAHLVIGKDNNPSKTLKQARKQLNTLYDFHSLTLQVEHHSNSMDTCKKCKNA